MLEWQRDLLGEPPVMPSTGAEGESAMAGSGSGGRGSGAAVSESRQVQVLIVPIGKIEQVERGTTAGDIIRAKVRANPPPFLILSWYQWSALRFDIVATIIIVTTITRFSSLN